MKQMKLGMVTKACSPNAQEAETPRSQSRGISKVATYKGFPPRTTWVSV